MCNKKAGKKKRKKRKGQTQIKNFLYFFNEINLLLKKYYDPWIDPEQESDRGIHRMQESPFK